MKTATLESTHVLDHESTTLQRVHFDYPDGFRGIAALFVVFHHAWLQTWPVIVYPGTGPQGFVAILTGWLLYGHFAVTFFIALSGFSLMIPVIRAGELRGGSSRFFLGRVRRIFPPYYAALALSVLIAALFLRIHTGTLYDDSLPVTWTGVLLHIGLVHNLFHDARPQINGPMWSVATECQIYLLFPFLVWLWRRFGIQTVLILTSVSVIISRLSIPARILNVHFLFVFGLGMFAALQGFEDRYSRFPRVPDWIYRVVFLVSCGCVVYLTHQSHLERLLLEDVFVGIACACAIILATRSQGSIFRKIGELPFFVWIGAFSYSLYLIHFPIQQLFWQTFIWKSGLSKLSGFLIVAFVSTALILGISFVFYRTFEKPFMRSKPKV